MIVAGITGGIRHGKTTLAGLLAAQAGTVRHFESWELIAEVAHELRDSGIASPASTDIDAINEWLHLLPEAVRFCTHQDVPFADIKLTKQRVSERPELYRKLFQYLELIAKQPALAHQEITAENKDTFRPLLQWLGGYLVEQVGSGIWYNELIRRIAYLQSNGYDLVTVGGVRYPGDAERLRNIGGIIVAIERPSQPTTDSTDLTECKRSLIVPDSHIYNDANLEALATLSADIYTDLMNHELRPEYRASAV